MWSGIPARLETARERGEGRERVARTPGIDRRERAFEGRPVADDTRGIGRARIDAARRRRRAADVAERAQPLGCLCRHGRWCRRRHALQFTQLLRHPLHNAGVR